MSIKGRIATAILVVLVILGLAASLYFVDRRNIGQIVEQGHRANILVMGLDKVGKTQRTDTLMLVSIAANSSDIKVISIPRDLYVKYPNGDFLRINAAYERGGPKLSRTLVSNLLGIDIPFHLVIDYQGFKHLINQIGSVTIRVQKPLTYTDTSATPPLDIDIPAGKQKLNSQEALGYVRYRGQGSDIQRIERQQKFLQALLDQGIQLKNWEHIKGLLSTAYNYVQTNLSLVDLYDLGKALQGLDLSQLDTATLPGTAARVNGKSVLQPDITGIHRLIAEQIKNLDLLTNSEINVAVLNGEGSTWLAHNAMKRLQNDGFKVVLADNADRFDYKTSFIVEMNSAHKRMAYRVAGSLQVPTKVVSADNFQKNLESIKNSGVTIPEKADVLVVLGKGAKKLVS